MQHVLTERHCLFEKQTRKLVFHTTKLVYVSFNLDQSSAMGCRACERASVLARQKISMEEGKATGSRTASLDSSPGVWQ